MLQKLHLLRLISLYPDAVTLVIARKFQGKNRPTQDELDDAFQKRTVAAAFGLEIQEYLI